MKLRLPKWLLEFTGNTYLCKQPMFFHYKPAHHKVNGKEVRMILEAIQPGDILLRRYDGYLNSILTTLSSGSFWGHAAIAISGDTVVHAVSQGVIYEDILEFSRCDSLAVLSVKGITPTQRHDAVNIACQFVGQKWEYDYRFERGNGKLYCTEVADSCHNGIFYDEFSMEMGNFLLTPDNIFNSEHVEKVLVIKH